MTLTGPTPILDTVYRGDAAGLARLLAAGGRPALFETAAVGDAAVVRQLAAENPAAVEGDAETVQTLLAHGAAAAPTHDGRTALAIAEERGHAAIARRLRGELP